MSQSEKQPLLNGRVSSDESSQRSRDDSTSVTFRGQCTTAITSEFKCHNIGFGHCREDLFYSCQWDWPPIIFVLYRLLTATYAFVILFWSIYYYDVNRWKHYPWAVWLTHWSFFMLTAYLVVSAAVCILHALERGRCCQIWSLRSSVYSFIPDTSPLAIPNPVPFYIKIQWLLFSVCGPAAIVVTLVFFTALYPQLNPQGGFSFGDATLHMSNTLLVLCDLIVSAVPVRLLHCIYVWVYGFIYMIFSLIYWAVDHSHVLYPKVLDWNHPVATSVTILLLVFVGTPLIQLLFFGAYKLRLKVYKCIYGSFTY